MNQPTTPNTVDDFLPLPKPAGIIEVREAMRTYVENGYTLAQVHAAILADRARTAAPVVAEGLTDDQINDGLRKHRLEVVKPSQLSDSFRNGMRYAATILPAHPVAGSPKPTCACGIPVTKCDPEGVFTCKQTPFAGSPAEAVAWWDLAVGGFYLSEASIPKGVIERGGIVALYTHAARSPVELWLPVEINPRSTRYPADYIEGFNRCRTEVMVHNKGLE